MAQAQRVLILSGVVLLALATAAAGAQLAARLMAINLFEHEGEIHEIQYGSDVIFQLDTDADVWDPLATHTEPFIRDYSEIASGPDGKLFFVQRENNYDDAGDYRGRWTRILSLTPEIGPGGGIVYGSERLEYQLYTAAVGGDLPDRIGRVQTGPGARADDYDLFFSISWGAGQDGLIYRVTAEDSAEVYYTVDLDHLGLPSCGAGGQWAGDFDFDDDGNLYLSSGNSIPSGLFMARRLGSGDLHHRPDLVTQRTEGGMVGLAHAEGALYFYDWEPAGLDPEAGTPRFDYTVYEIDPATASIEAVFSDPLARSVLSLAEMPPPPRFDSGPMKILPDVHPSDLWFGAPRLVPKEDDPRIAILELPLWISMQNIAAAAAPPFLLHFEARLGSDKPLEVAFVRAGHAKGGPAWKSSLPAGGSVTLGGTLRLSIPKGVQVEGLPLYLKATVDSCAGEMKMPSTCRVKESDETNNVLMTQIQMPMKMPVKMPPKVLER